MVGRIDAHHHAKFSRNWSIQSRHITIFQFFKMEAVAILIVKFAKFIGWWCPWGGNEARGALCTSLPGTVFHRQHRQVAEQWVNLCYRSRSWPLSGWMPRYCQICKMLLAKGVQRVESHQLAKFCRNRSIGCENLHMYRFFKIAAVRHLEFVWGTFGPPAVSTWESLPHCLIWLWSMQLFL